jgi:ribosomal protein S18 acetylase RimI-like enzyme
MYIRLATCEDKVGIATVHVDSWRTSYRGILPDKFLAELSYQHRIEMWERALCMGTRKSFVFVAESDDHNIVGFASGGPSQTHDNFYKGELYAIYLIEEQQHRGIGRALFEAVMTRLSQDGYKNIFIWVFEKNLGARGFYERLGGKLVRKQPIRVGETDLYEVAYGWNIEETSSQSIDQK